MDVVVGGIGVLAVTALSEAVFVLIAAALVSSLVPIPASVFAAKLYPYFQYDVHPEREALLFRVFVLSAIGIFALLAWGNRGPLQAGQPLRAMRRYCACSLGLNALLLASVFKIIVTGNPPWARGVLYAGLFAGVLGRIFFPEVCRLAAAARSGILDWLRRSVPVRGLIFDGVAAALLVLFLWPDMHAVLAEIFVRDQFYHIDVMLAAPGWGIINRLVPNIDITAPYGVVIPWAFTRITGMFGGFDYPGIVTVLVIFAIAYYALFYVLLRRFLQSRWLAAAGTCLAVKWQLFHWGVAPLAWSYPMATPLRAGADLVTMYAVLAYLRGGSPRWLWAGGLAAGVSLVWMSDMGVYLMIAWLVFLALLFHARMERPVTLAALAALPVLTGAGVLAAVTGAAVTSSVYWRHLAEHASLFINGWGALPMTDGLKDRQFWAYVMGFAFPCVYVWTFLVTAGMALMRRQVREYGVPVFLCVYGLGAYHYFIFRSAVSSYCAVCIPLVMVLMYVFKQVLDRQSAGFRGRAEVLAAVAAFLMLGTNYFFTFYPNVLHLGGYNFQEEKAYYREHFDFAQDAALIDALTSPEEPVALISSQETKILMQARRKPYFYYVPLMESSLMATDRMRHTFLYTKDRLIRTLDQLKAAPSPYIFVERKLYKAAAASPETALAALAGAINRDYAAVREGQYLTAFKRK